MRAKPECNACVSTTSPKNNPHLGLNKHPTSMLDVGRPPGRTSRASLQFTYHFVGIDAREQRHGTQLFAKVFDRCANVINFIVYN